MLGVKSATNAPALNVWLFKDSLPVWSYPLFIQNYFMAVEQQTGSYWVGITWSLAIEEQFYLIMPLLAFVLRRSQVFFLALVCIAIAFFLRVAFGNDWWNYFGTPFRMDSLMFGAAVACVVRDERILKFCRRWRAVLDVATIFLAMLALQTPLLKLERLYCFSIMSAVTAYIILRIHLVDGGWVRSVLRAQVLVQLGAISYPLYMYHQAVNGLVHGIWFGKEPAILEFRQLMAAVLVMTISIVLAALSTRYFERPFRQKGKTLKYSFEPAIGASAIQVEAPLLEARAG
jgi:peptidoglycan/LPS O-acetylase OafA/YrhL